MHTLKPGLRKVTKHLRLRAPLGLRPPLDEDTVHFRVGDTVLIGDVGPKFAWVTSSERPRPRVRATVATILEHTEVLA